MDPDTTQKLSDHQHKAEKQRRRFYARRPKTIEAILAQVITKRGYAVKRGAAELTEAWAAAAGPTLAPHTRVVGVRRGQLEVTVANSAMMQEINFQRPTLLAAMQKALPDARIANLRLKVGRLR